MEDLIFELNRVNFSYLGRFPALRDIDFKAEKGRRIAIIGANGSGKSTLLHLLDGLLFPDKGVVRFSGHEITEKILLDAEFNRYFRRSVGLVFQNPDVQLFCPTVREEIYFGPLNFGFDKSQISEVFDNITGILGIKELCDRMPHQLSIGEKRKVAMASVLISGPEVLLLDEPTAGLDPKTAMDLVELLNRYHADGKTIITATHDMHIVEEVADLVYVFGRDKSVIRAGHPHDILSDEAFLQDNNLIHVHSHAHGGKTHKHPHQHLHHAHLHHAPKPIMSGEESGADKVS